MPVDERADDFLGLLERSLPGARVVARDVTPTEDPTVEHMYKLNEPVFGAVARDMVARGWSVFPQEPFGQRRPGTVNNEMIRWSEKYDLANRRPDPKTLDLWCAQCASLNVAVVLGPASGHTFVVDIDVTEPDLSAQIQELAERILGRTPLRRVGREPKMALVYRHAPDEEIPGRSPKFAAYDAAGNVIRGDQGIEIISSGQAMTFFGKHHGTGKYFRWLEGSPSILGPEAAPLVTAAQVNDFLDAVDSVRQFHKSSSFDFATVTTWEWDENARIHIPRIRSSGAATNWVEDENGIVIDGREAYLTRLAHRIVTANAHLAHDTSGRGTEMLTKIVVEQFMATAETTGRWRGKTLEREARSKVMRTAEKIRSGKLQTRAPIRDASGVYMPTINGANHIPPQPRRQGGDSLDFLPPAVDVRSPGFDPNAPGQRRPIKCVVHEPREGAAEERRIAEDRSKVAEGVASALQAAFKAFWDEVYDASRTQTRVHILKAPTGAGKTSRGIQFIATDPRTKEDYTVRGPNGETIHHGRSPIVFLLPTYANIEELRHRAQVLNLDPSLPDAQLREQAEEMGLIHEDDLEERLAELRRDAKKAGLRTMIYSGKLKAGCRMHEKVKLAMEAGIGTAGFCQAEVVTDKRDEQGRPKKETKYCEFYDTCEAIRQRKMIERSHVVFMPHAFLSLTIPEELKNVRAVVADERIHHLFLHTAELDTLTFLKPRKPPRLTKAEREAGVIAEEFQWDREEAVKIVNLAIHTKQCPVEALARHPGRDPDGTPTALRLVRSAIRACGAAIQRDGTITPDMTLEEVRELCAQPTGHQAREEYRFWKIVEERLELRIQEILHERLAREAGREPPPRKTKGDREYRIQVLEDVGQDGQVVTRIRISWRQQPNWVDRPLLLLDASAAPDMISKIWSGKEVVVHDIPAALNVRVVAVVDRTYSNASVVAPPSATPQEKLTSARLLNKVRKVISMLSGLYGWSRVVAGGSILVRRAVNTDWEGPHNVDWCHFGAMRGLDFAKHHAAAVSVGRMELPIRTIDGLVAALTYDDDDPEKPYDLHGTGLGPDGQPLRIPMGVQRIKLRSGHDVEMPVPMFPGRWGRMIQKQYREEELLQFLGRLRPVYREGDAPIWFSLSSVIPEEVIVDDLIHIDDLLRGAYPRELRIWEAMRRARGVLDADVAAATCEDLYPSRKAVIDEMRMAGLNPQTGEISGRAGWGLVAVRWKTPDGKTGVGFVRAEIQDAEEALRNALGEHLGIEAVEVERISQSRGQTMARGRLPDKIETELGTPEERRSAERRLSERVAMDVLMSATPEALRHLLDRKERPVPLMIPAGVGPLEGEEDEGEGRKDQERLSLDEVRAKVVIENIWKSVRRSADHDLGADAAKRHAEGLDADVSYEGAGNHVMDADPELPESIGEFDELDDVIPW